MLDNRSYHWAKLRSKIFFFSYKKKKRFPYYRNLQKLALSLRGAENWTTFIGDVSFSSHQVSRILKTTQTLTSSNAYSGTTAQILTCLFIWINKYMVEHLCLHSALLSLPWRALPSPDSIFFISKLRPVRWLRNKGAYCQARQPEFDPMDSHQRSWQFLKIQVVFILEYGLTSPIPF